jgi:3-deoxy-manno-octulosonate cytidylyltransferase (CMP-KDO synthetase)
MLEKEPAVSKQVVAGIIPARFASTRLPGKPLEPILGKPMIQRVYECCITSNALDHLFVATDDERIRDAVEHFGGKAIMTRADHPTGTDRLAEASGSLSCDIVVNIQGDQPFFDPVMIDEVVQPLLDDSSTGLSTLMYPIQREEDLDDIGVVKVVANLAGNAMYFSRSLIPYPHKSVPHPVYEHIGLYAYRKDTLRTLATLPPTVHEQVESLEQLRWLDHGLPIRVVETRCTDQAFCGFSVDTIDDLRRGEAMLRERGLD